MRTHDVLLENYLTQCVEHGVMSRGLLKGGMVGRGKGKDGLWALHCKKDKKGKKGDGLVGNTWQKYWLPVNLSSDLLPQPTHPTSLEAPPPSSPLRRVIFRLLFKVFFPVVLFW